MLSLPKLQTWKTCRKNSSTPINQTFTVPWKDSKRQWQPTWCLKSQRAWGWQFTVKAKCLNLLWSSCAGCFLTDKRTWEDPGRAALQSGCRDRLSHQHPGRPGEQLSQQAAQHASMSQTRLLTKIHAHTGKQCFCGVLKALEHSNVCFA